MDENLAILRLLFLDNNNNNTSFFGESPERRLLRRTKNSSGKKKPPPVSNHPRFRRGHRLPQTFQPFLSLQNRVQKPLFLERVDRSSYTPVSRSRLRLAVCIFKAFCLRMMKVYNYIPQQFLSSFNSFFFSLVFSFRVY